VSPLATTLGPVKQGETAEKKVVVRGSNPFRIIGVRGTDSQITIQDTPNENKSVHVLTVRLKPTRVGDQNWSIHVYTDMKDDNEVEFQAKASVTQ
jgi:hypothetical protein